MAAVLAGVCMHVVHVACIWFTSTVNPGVMSDGAIRENKFSSTGSRSNLSGTLAELPSSWVKRTSVLADLSLQLHLQAIKLLFINTRYQQVLHSQETTETCWIWPVISTVTLYLCIINNWSSLWSCCLSKLSLYFFFFFLIAVGLHQLPGECI